jgi:transcriptional regulator with XRE-family HTH domain
VNAERLADLRHEQPKTRQVDIAKMLGIGTSTYSVYEQGLREPDDETKIKIAQYFHVSVDYLVGNSDLRTPHPTRSVDTELTALRHQLRDTSAKPMYHGQELTAPVRKSLAALLDGVVSAADALTENDD